MHHHHPARRLCAMLLVALSACADDAPPTANVLTEQTKAIEQAADVNKLVEDAAAAQRQAIEQQSQ